MKTFYELTEDDIPMLVDLLVKKHAEQDDKADDSDDPSTWAVWEHFDPNQDPPQLVDTPTTDKRVVYDMVDGYNTFRLADLGSVAAGGFIRSAFVKRLVVDEWGWLVRQLFPASKVRGLHVVWNGYARTLDIEDVSTPYPVNIISYNGEVFIRTTTPDHDGRAEILRCALQLADAACEPTAKKSAQIGVLLPSSLGNGYTIQFSDIEADPMNFDTFYSGIGSAWFDRITSTLADGTKGLLLLHGPPGTGKTTLIRQMAARLAGEKTFVFLSRIFLTSVSTPSLLGALMAYAHKNLVLVIEDAEALVQRREDAQDSHDSDIVSFILNVTDGLLNDVLKTQVICTYNASGASIDPALLRAGRLIESVYVGPLAAASHHDVQEGLNDPISLNGPAMLLARHLGRKFPLSYVERDATFTLAEVVSWPKSSP